MAKWENMKINSDKLERRLLEFNANEKVVVFLTKYWEECLKNYYMDYYRDRDYKNEGYGSLEEYVEKKVIPTRYKNGYYEDSLFMIMNIFWNECQDDHLASPFKGCNIYFREWFRGAEKVSDEVNQALLWALN